MEVYNKFEIALLEWLNYVSDVQTKAWYNQQYENTDEEKAIVYPAVFFELGPLRWKQLGDKQQSATARLTLHHVINDYDDSPNNLFDLVQKVYNQLTHVGLNQLDQNPLTSEFVRTDSELVTRFKMLKVMKVDYTFELYDYSIVTPTTAVNATFQINS